MRPKTAQSFHPHERAQTTTTGYIYILTNPSFPQYGKLGYATDVKQRPAELNRRILPSRTRSSTPFWAS